MLKPQSQLAPFTLSCRYRYSALGVLICSRKVENLEKKYYAHMKTPRKQFCFTEEQFYKNPGNALTLQGAGPLIFTKACLLPSEVHPTPPPSPLLNVHLEGSPPGIPERHCLALTKTFSPASLEYSLYLVQARRIRSC